MKAEHRKTDFTLIIKGKVQSVGFRGYMGEACERLGIGGISYNIGTEEVRILCKAERERLEELSRLLRKYEFADIYEIDIEEGTILPDLYYRSIYDSEKEIFARLDEGVRVLHTINDNTYAIKDDTRAIKDDTRAIKDDTRAIKDDTRAIKDDTHAIREDTKKIGDVVDTNKEILKTLKEMSQKL